MAIGVYALEGKRTDDRSVKFSVRSSDGKETLRSVMKITADGKLLGMSHADVPFNGRAATFRYEWDAEPYTAK